MEAVSPIALSQESSTAISITWEDGKKYIYPCKDLRDHCQCAGCVDEVTRIKKLKRTDIPEDIHPIKISPVGRYAFHILWSDGHDSGIYTFDLLRSLGEKS